MDSNTDHTHTWNPLPEHFMRYVCAECGATGYRHHSGHVVAHTKQRKDLLKSVPPETHVSWKGRLAGESRLGKRGAGEY